MRDFKGMKRQRGRNRSGGNASGGGGKPQQNVNRAFDSNGPDSVKIRGHAQHVFEKYQQLARDAFSSGDRVLAENYLQHADHYFRVLRTIQPNRPPSEILGRDVFASGLDIDFEDDGEGFDDAPDGGEFVEANGAETRFEGRSEPRSDAGRYENGRSEGRQENGRQESGRQENGRFDGRRDDRSDRFEPRRNAQENGRFEGRRDTPDNRYNNRRDVQEPRETRFEGSRDDPSSREPRGDNRRDYADARDNRREAPEQRDTRRDIQDQRESRPEPSREATDAREVRSEGRQDGRRFETRRDREPRDDRRYGARSEIERDDSSVAEPSTTSDLGPAPSPAVVPDPVQTEASPLLRSEDGGVSQAPAFLQNAAPTSPGDAVQETEPRKPKPRRRRPKTSEAEDEGVSAATPAVAEEV